MTTPQPSEQPTTYDRELFLRIAEHLQRAARETGYTHPEHLSGSEYPATDIPCLPEIVAEQIVEKYLIEAEAAVPDPVASPLGEAQGEPMDTTADRDLIEELRDALIWCGGSDDFAPGGKAREGWEKIVLPLLDKTSKP